MNWRRLYITVEGPTERKFAEDVLQPHLALRSLDVRPRVVITNRKLGKRGGIMDYSRIRDDLLRLMKEDRDHNAVFTTMVDLYALPKEFPGWKEAKQMSRAQDRVSLLETAFQSEMGDPRLLPYIQLHEFEARKHQVNPVPPPDAGSSAGQ
jgi:hypothetical protein